MLAAVLMNDGFAAGPGTAPPATNPQGIVIMVGVGIRSVLFIFLLGALL